MHHRVELSLPCTSVPHTLPGEGTNTPVSPARHVSPQVHPDLAKNSKVVLSDDFAQNTLGWLDFVTLFHNNRHSQTRTSTTGTKPAEDEEEMQQVPRPIVLREFGGIFWSLDLFRSRRRLVCLDFSRCHAKCYCSRANPSRDKMEWRCSLAF